MLRYVLWAMVKKSMCTFSMYFRLIYTYFYALTFKFVLVCAYYWPVISQLFVPHIVHNINTRSYELTDGMNHFLDRYTTSPLNTSCLFRFLSLFYRYYPEQYTKCVCIHTRPFLWLTCCLRWVFVVCLSP